jgi:hypothetical protein
MCIVGDRSERARVHHTAICGVDPARQQYDGCTDPWTVGAHPVSFFNSGGTALANGTGSITVAIDPTTIPTTTIPTTTIPTTTIPTTTMTIPVTTPTVAQGASLNPIVAAQGFSILTEGNVNLTGVGVASGVATGGDVSWHSYGTVTATAKRVASLSAAQTTWSGGSRSHRVRSRQVSG